MEPEKWQRIDNVLPCADEKGNYRKKHISRDEVDIALAVMAFAMQASQHFPPEQVVLDELARPEINPCLFAYGLTASVVSLRSAVAHRLPGFRLDFECSAPHFGVLVHTDQSEVTVRNVRVANIFRLMTHKLVEWTGHPSLDALK